MKKVLYFFLVMVFSLLMAWQPVCSAFEAPGARGQDDPAAAAEGEVCETGRGQGFEPCPPEEECPATFGPIITDTAVPIEKGKFAIQPTWALSFTTASFSPSWRRVSAGGDYTSFSQLVKLSYGLWDNLEVFLEMNTYQHNWARNVDVPGPKGETSADFGSFGNTFLVFKYQLVKETPTIPVVTAFFGTVFPTGHYRYLNPSRLGTDQIGNGGYQFIFGFNLQKYLQPFILYSNIWYRVGTSYHADGEDAEGNPIQLRVNPRNNVIINLAAEYPITKKWVALLEVVSSWDTGFQFAGVRPNQPRGSFLAISPGIEYMATDKLAFALGVSVDVIGRNNDATVTPLLSVVYNF